MADQTISDKEKILESIRLMSPNYDEWLLSDNPHTRAMARVHKDNFINMMEILVEQSFASTPNIAMSAFVAFATNVISMFVSINSHHQPDKYSAMMSELIREIYAHMIEESDRTTRLLSEQEKNRVAANGGMH